MPVLHATGISLPDFASRMVGTSVSAVVSSPMSVMRTLIQVSPPTSLQSFRPHPRLTVCCALPPSVLHPISLAARSPQLGHEPIAPKPHVNFLGQSGFLRPGMIKYGKELVSTHGYKALFIGIEVRFWTSGLTGPYIYIGGRGGAFDRVSFLVDGPHARIRRVLPSRSRSQ